MSKQQRVILTPVDLSTAVATGKGFKKQILPFGSIDYKGTKITFDKKMLSSIAAAFKGRAYDQVPIVLADAENRHNMDPTKFAGEVTNLSVEADGLYATVTPSKKARGLLKDNPRLGVSARIVPGLTKSDGRRFDFAIQHVLLTMDPRVTGMKPWETVDLSADDNRKVVDLTTGTIKEDAVADKKSKKKNKGEVVGETVTTVVIEDPDETKGKSKGEEEVDVRDLTDDEIDALLIDEVASDSTDLSTDADEVLDLAGGAAAADTSLRDEVQTMRLDLAADRWEAERTKFVRNGVPPFLLDLAAPVLSSPDAVMLDLSTSDEPIDAKTTIRNLLTGVQGMIDFTPEMGHGVDLSSDQDESTEQALLNEWNQYGTV